MNFVANAAISAAVINAALAAFVFYTNPRSTLNRVYVLWGGCVSLWNFAAFFKSFPYVTEEQATVWVGVIQGAVIFLPLALAHLCQLIIHNRTPKWIYPFYALHIGLLLSLIFTPYYMQGVQRVSVLGWWAVAGPFFKVYLASYAILTIPLVLGLPVYALRVKSDRRSQILVLWLSILTLWITGTNDLMPILGPTYYPGTNLSFIALGNLGAILYGIAVAYSVLQHQLLDIYYAFGKATSLLLRVCFVVAISLLPLFVGSAIKPGSFDWYEIIMALAAFAFSTLIATFLFPKLLGGPVGRLERAMLGDRFELPDKVRAFIEQMKWQLDLNTVLDELAKFLAGTFRLRGFSVVLLGETRRDFSVVRSLPPRSPVLLPNLQNNGSIFSVPDSGEKFILLQDKPIDGGEDPQAKLRREIQGLEGRIVFPFRVEEQPLGFLLIGDKQNGSSISSEEARHLSEIAVNIILVVNQISLKNQIVRAQEFELIGRMSQGMAHDLRNLTTPISTLIQLLEEGSLEDLLKSDLVPVSKRNMQKMTDYIQESLFFTESLGLNIHPLRLDVLVQRLLANLIANAVDASEPGGLIRVILTRTNMEKGREWVRIQVIDNGSGIPPEVRDRIFEPYFSTKKTGDSERGFGLGLAICRKIATLHGGTLTVASEVGRGTTFSLDLPTHPVARGDTEGLTEPRSKTRNHDAHHPRPHAPTRLRERHHIGARPDALARNCA